MKMSVRLVCLAVVAAVIAAPAQSEAARSRRSYEAGEPGRLLIRYSPTLGINVALAVEINGRPAGGITRGHTYVAHLPPGRHVIGVSRNGRLYDSSARILNVRPGQTYSFLAKYRVNEMILVPAARRSRPVMSPQL